jgi:methyl-accepting chemotaxis protein
MEHVIMPRSSSVAERKARVSGGFVTWVYVAGILLGLAVAFYILLADLLREEGVAPASLDVLGIALFVLGVTHMLVLLGVSFMTDVKDRVQAGEQVQTAGYLHTLIGFAVALLLIRSSINSTGAEFGIATVLGPLGSALVTSIIGWFVGGLIIRSGGIAETEVGRSELEALRTESGRVAAELAGFANGVRRAHEDYLKGVIGLSAAHKELTAKQRDALDRSVTVATEIGDHLNKLKASVAGLSSVIESLATDVSAHLGEPMRVTLRDVAGAAKEVETGLKTTAESAKSTAKYLQESRVLIEELERVLDSVVDARRPAA